VSDDEMFRGNKYSGSVYGELAGKLEVCISVRVSASEIKGIMVNAQKEYLRRYWFKSSFGLRLSPSRT